MDKPVSLFTLTAAIIVAAWWWLGSPVPMPPSPLAVGEKLYCVSYAPFRGAQSPLDLSTKIAPAQIEQDRRLNTLHQAQQAQLPSKSVAAPPPGETLILDALKDHLVRCHDGAIDRVDGREGNHELVAAGVHPQRRRVGEVAFAETQHRGELGA